MMIPESYNYFTNPDNLGAQLDNLPLGHMSDEEVDDLLTQMNLPLPDRISLVSRSVSKHPVERWEVVQDRFLPGWAVDRLAKDEQPEIRAFVALHPNASRDALDILAVDTYNLVRFNVAIGGRFSPDVAQLLAHDEDPEIRAVMVSHYVLHDHEALDGMADDESELVRGAVAMLSNNLDILQGYYEKDSEAVWSRIASNLQAPLCLLEAILDRCLTDEFEDARATMFHLAKHKKASRKMLKMIGASDYEVARGTAQARLK